MGDIDEIIAAINPSLYYSGDKKEQEEVSKRVKSDGAIKAIKGLKDEKKWKGTKADISHNLIYDSSSETLEPVYFWLLDLMNDLQLKPEKLIDNFSSTPGSGHFSELGGKATVMQQQASKILGDVNTVLRSVLNIVYDLKDFKMRLQHYDSLKSKKKEEQEAAILSLKQIWMDKVDIAKGNSSIKAMGIGQAGFQTLIDAFLFAKDESLKGPDGNEIDLNDRIKRILKPRILEFNIWIKESEKELRKRYELEKTYLKSQVSSLNLYSRWARPYLKAAQDLESKDFGTNPALVKTFNSIILELTLMGKLKLDVGDEAVKGNLPKDFSKPKYLNSMKRQYYSVILVDFVFRGIPQKIGQQSQYVFGGRTEITFKGYALNDDELNKFKDEMKKSDLNNALSLIEGATTESLGQMQAEIDSFLNEKPEEDKKDKKYSWKDLFEPFTALFGGYEESASPSTKPKKEEKKEIIVEPDTWIEGTHFRPLAQETAKAKAYDLVDFYKKGHGMASFT
jgi:hypothetical protein